ncbi:hypothetical protein [Paenibacillus planticolens]|uniref:Uncharacterized protein n=1 Tax=Paenibacillus planticolens TaxID=2654976 RepID=A0ABX1ZMJ4_9BACL|nr:hypothetical protein [Paenibacillus planticolens]NOV01315.1 hypothetical protein [Paenibacillus planticolens]
MIMDWLEPTIEKRALDLIEVADEESNDLYEKFISIAAELKADLPESSWSKLYELENLFNLKSNRVVQFAYKTGIQDSLNFINEMRKII